MIDNVATLNDAVATSYEAEEAGHHRRHHPRCRRLLPALLFQLFYPFLPFFSSSSSVFFSFYLSKRALRRPQPCFLPLQTEELVLAVLK